MKTLISFVGKGHILKGTDVHAYLKTQYDFGGGVTYETSCFADAIRLSGKYDVDEVLFIGSCTSSWSTLLEQAPDAEDLFLELYERGEKEIPLGDKEKELQCALEKLWGKPVRLCVSVPELLPENSEEILNKYIGALLASGRDILFDITHGFRWMPVLLTSVLQLANSYQSGDTGNIEVIYGELQRDAASPVRYLDILIKGQRISDAVALFFQKFEAEPLAELLTPYWESGAVAIRKLGLNIQGNYFLPLLIDFSEDNFPVGRPVAQLRNALKDFEPESQPAWVINAHCKLAKIVKELAAESATARLLNLAKLLAECSYYGQSILLVCLAMEQDLMETMGCKKHPGYDGVRYLQDVFIEEEKKKPLRSPYKECFFNIKHLRNRIAHGGLSGNGAPTMQQAESLKEQYNKILRKQQELHQYLKNAFRVPSDVEAQMEAGKTPWKPETGSVPADL